MEDMTMNDAPDIRATSNTGSTLIGFALGAVVGAGLALLLAPDSGKKTRQRLAATARRWSDDAGSTIDQARHTVAELGADAKCAIKAGQEAFVHDRATRESRSDRRMSHSGDAAPDPDAGSQSDEEAAR
jgi:gas vesicle protein